ncbi:MAG: TIGR03617 family F420-dependent LLM class oxidoreductase [Acidobacteria bacterium]|nr:TIGR03617 family F420-dependent LLM class oxidoreductase [Acidobacteriota bacterium]
MKVDIRLGGSIPEIAEQARRAEAMGFDAAWTTETAHDGYLPLVSAAMATTRLQLGTSIAVAFGRSPMVTAHLAWDLAALSQGRFILGLGTQVKGHIQKRYGLTWDSPGPRLRDYVQALRAIWHCWQHGTPLHHQGEFYSHTLMTPFFDPGSIEHPQVPIHIAGVQKYMCRLAGELCDGFQVHPFHSVRYLRELVLPNVERGLRASGRTRADLCLASSVFVVTGTGAGEMESALRGARSQIGFYASTPNYRVVLECHGWDQVARELTRKSIESDWEGMAALVTDEMLDAFAVVGTPAEVSQKLRQRYTGLLDRLAVYEPFRPEGDLTAQRALVAAFPR